MNGRQAGQASVEVLALVPVLVLAALLAIQLAGLVRATLVAQDGARSAAIAAPGHGTLQVPVTVRVPSLLPFVDDLEVRARAVVRAP